MPSKSQADRSRRMSCVQVTPPPVQELEMEDVVPGRLTHAQWVDMLAHEDAEEAVGEIMDELLGKVMQGCLKVFIERQIAPFSASWATSCLTQILEQQILCPDEGEGLEEASGTEDSEPTPATSDAWAQGCVPVVSAAPRPPPADEQEADILQAPAQTETKVNHQFSTGANSSSMQSEKKTSPRAPVSDKQLKVLHPHPPPKTEKRQKKQPVNLLPKHVPGKLLPVLSCSAEKKNADVDGKKCLSGPLYDPKDHQHIPRLDPSCLPRHCIFPQYEIVDYNYTPNHKKPSRLSKLEAKYDKQQTERSVTTLTPLINSEDHPEKLRRRNEADVFLKKMSPSRQERTAFSGSLRLDTIVLAKGVSLQDSQAVESSPLKLNPLSQSTKLRPIRSDIAVPLFSADQLTTGRPPRVTPLIQSKNYAN